MRLGERMSEVPEELRYTKEHEWIRVEGDSVVIGVTDYAQNALTDVVWVELPEMGAVVGSMDSFARSSGSRRLRQEVRCSACLSRRPMQLRMSKASTRAMGNTAPMSCSQKHRRMIPCFRNSGIFGR